MKITLRIIGLLAALCASAALSACVPAVDEPQSTPALERQSSVAQESLADMVARLSPSVVGVASVQDGRQGIGSGVIVSETGYILTNHHVVGAAGENGTWS